MYLEIDPRIAEDKKLSLLRQETHRFAEEVVRPAAKTLDRMSDPAKVIEKDSSYWHVLREMKKLGYHKIFVDPDYGGLGLSATEAHVIMEELGWGSVGLATAIGVDQIP